MYINKNERKKKVYKVLINYFAYILLINNLIVIGNYKFSFVMEYILEMIFQFLTFTI
jgi:hypothetical protein